MTRLQIIEALNRYRFFISDISDEALLRTNDLGVQSLSKYKESHKDIVTRLDLVLENSNEISSKVLDQINIFYNDYANFIQDTIALDDLEFVNNRKSIITRFDLFIEDMKDLWQQIAGIITNKDENRRLKKLSNTIEDHLTLLEEKNQKLQVELDETEVLKKSLESQINDYRKETSDLSIKKELIDQTYIFYGAAKKNQNNSYYWFGGIILFSIALVVLIFYIKANFCFDISCYEPKNLTIYNSICRECGEHVLWLEIFKSLFFRLLIISINIYLITFCVKNYNASMHNKVINEHRHNSFASAFHFFNSTTSERKDEILVKAADSIFTYQKTGYYGKDSEPSNPSIIQSVIEKVSGKAE